VQSRATDCLAFPYYQSEAAWAMAPRRKRSSVEHRHVLDLQLGPGGQQRARTTQAGVDAEESDGRSSSVLSNAQRQEQGAHGRPQPVRDGDADLQPAARCRRDLDINPLHPPVAAGWAEEHIEPSGRRSSPLLPSYARLPSRIMKRRAPAGPGGALRAGMRRPDCRCSQSIRCFCGLPGS
jgi:hypothetical protein